jgi:hypothetical protein
MLLPQEMESNLWGIKVVEEMQGKSAELST